MKETGVEIVKFNENLKQVQDKHQHMMKYFNIEKSNDMNDDSTIFFKFFLDFFKKCEQSLPPKEKGLKTAAKIIKQKIDPLMDEMKKKLAAKRMKAPAEGEK